MKGNIVITHGYNGWGNRKSGEEAYGPEGRWRTPRQKNDGGGDLLGDHLAELGCKEGSPFIVIASDNRFDANLIYDLMDERHIIDLRPDGWTIQHPLRERCDGTLFDCRFNWVADDLGYVGRFVLDWDDEGDFSVLGERLS